MKLPRILWAEKEFQTPTRRKFLQWASALFLPKPPIDVWGILRDTLNTQEGGEILFYTQEAASKIFWVRKMGQMIWVKISMISQAAPTINPKKDKIRTWWIYTWFRKTIMN